MKINRRKFCECGCGQRVKKRFVSGHNSCMRTGEKHHFYGRHFSKEIVEKRNEAIREAWKDPIHKRNKVNALKKVWAESPDRKRANSDRMKGENNPSKRPEIRKIISKNMKNRVISESTRNKISDTVKKLWENETYRDRHCGKNHPQWVGGLSEYPNEWNDKLKSIIRQRDNHRCWLCRDMQEGQNYRLDVHHIDYNKKNCHPDNLVSLCKRCHRKTNVSKHARKEMTQAFLNLKKKMQRKPRVFF
jgi:5-methylcytosine-specific restriction endonuclease McrA